MTPPFYSQVDALSKGAISALPEPVQSAGFANNFLLATAGAYASARVLQSIGKNLMPKKFYDKILPGLEYGMAIGMPVGFALADWMTNGSARNFIMAHPDYMSGFVGLWAGGTAAVVQHSQERKQNEFEKTHISNNKRYELQNKELESRVKTDIERINHTLDTI